jgi:hypothetical protein
VKGLGEVIEGCGVIWVTRRTKGKSLSVVFDGLLQILHLSQLLKASENSIGKVAQQLTAPDIPRRTLLHVVSMMRNCSVQSFPHAAVCSRLLNTS